jgi:hypothetical protein
VPAAQHEPIATSRAASQAASLFTPARHFLFVVLFFSDVLVYFQSEEDRNTAWAPKIAVVLGLTLTCLLVLMLPLDVANRSSAGGLPMDVLWQILYILVAVMCIGVVPFMMFYYEAWDPEGKDWQLWTAVK